MHKTPCIVGLESQTFFSKRLIIFGMLFLGLSTIISVVAIIPIVTIMAIAMVQHKSLLLIAIAIQVLQSFFDDIHGMETIMQNNERQIN